MPLSPPCPRGAVCSSGPTAATAASPTEEGGGATKEGGAEGRHAARAVGLAAGWAGARRAAGGVEASGIEACAAALTGTERRGGELGTEHGYSADEARNTIIAFCSNYVERCSGPKIAGGGGLGRQQREMLQYEQRTTLTPTPTLTLNPNPNSNR